MGSICLSSASILRCTSLTQLENILLVIPTALEVVFSTALLFAKWGEGGKYLLLTAEGWTYFALVVIEMLSEIIPAVRVNTLFRAFDLGIGVASFLPIFFYTFFLFIFTGGELADTLPKRLQFLAKFALIIFVPAIIGFNEVASFVGVTIRNIPTGKDGHFMLTVGFRNNQQEGLWTFFTSLTLALLTVYQATVFVFAFFRLTQVLLHQRRIEIKGADKWHFLNGIGWISGAAKLGAIETVIGFAGGGFGVALTRRIVRMLSRACLCIGVFKGVDLVEDFQEVRGEILRGARKAKEYRQSRLRQFISNPRLSTFRQLSPTATGFHATARAPANILVSSDEKEKSSLFMPSKQQRQSLLTLKSGLPGMDLFASVKEKDSKKRVTIHFNNGTPKLHMRFSALDVPNPAIVVEKVKTRPESTWYDSNSQKSRLTQSSYYFDSGKREKTDVELQPPMPKFLQADPNGNRDSMNSIPSLHGPFEIVVAPQRRLSQKAAQARIYQASTNITPTTQASAMNQVPTVVRTSASETMAVMAFPQPIYYPSGSKSRPPTQDLDSSRIKSLTSVTSMPDSLQAVRELASQFPGPPLSAFQETVWEEDTSPSSVLYPPGVMAPQVLGSPSQLTFGERDGQRLRVASALEVDDDVTWGNANSQFSTPIVGSRFPPSPLRAGKVPITPQAGRYRASGTPRSIGRASNPRKSINPFDDDEGSRESSQRSTQLDNPFASEEPRAESRKVDIPPTLPSPARMPSVSRSPEDLTPATAISGFSEFQVVQVNGPDTDNPFLDLGTALDTGKSRLLKPMQPPVPIVQTPKSIKSPSSPRKFDHRGEKLSRIAEWVDSSAAVADAPIQTVIEVPVRNTSLQNLHDRGESIDNLAIPWLQSPDTMKENERRIIHAMSSSGQKSQPPSRLKSVGKVSFRPTPAPMHAGHTRGSLHLQPIVIPPRSGNMPEAVQIEYGSVESELSVGRGRGVLRDSEVLAVEDRRQKGNYF